MNRRYAALAAALAVGLVGLGVATADQAHGAQIGAQGSSVAHRGYLGWGAPENTHASFRHAIEAGFEAVEFDVRLTKDKRAVVLHDTSLDRTTTCAGPVSKITLAALAKCDASLGTIKATVPTYASTTAYLNTLSTTSTVFVHVKVRLDSAAATGLVKGAKSLTNSAKRVTFLIEEDADRKALIKAGWKSFGLMVHSTADWDLVVSAKYNVAVTYDSPARLQDAIVTPERVAAMAAAKVRLYAVEGEPQTREELHALGVDLLLV